MEEIKINYHYLNACDMKCKHCFGGLNTSSSNSVEILNTFETICKTTKAINLAGGEIFLNIELLEKLIKIAYEYSVNLSLVTNGDILLNNLESKQIKSIVEKVKVIGISIDSFNKKTNMSIGRVTKTHSALSANKVVKLKKMCDQFGTKLKINTVVSRNNIQEDFLSKIEKISPDIWKIIQVYSKDENIIVSEDEFNDFVKRHETDVQVKTEFSNQVTSSYIMFNSSGNLYYNKKFIPFNINEFAVIWRDPSKYFLVEFKKYGVDLEEYFNRYTNEKTEIYFNKKSYQRSLGEKLGYNGNTLFLDVESISPRPYDSKNLLKHSTTQLHLLYCGLVANSNLEIIARFSDNIDPNKDYKDSVCKSKHKFQNNKMFYSKFLNRIKDFKVKRIIVSGLETEMHFFQDCIYYIDDLSRKDYELIQGLLNNLIDIQSIKRKGILEIDSNKAASRAVLEKLNKIRSDIFPYTRKSFKNSKTSKHISDILAKIYFNNLDKFLVQDELTKIRRHCYQDVQDDYELLYCYELLSKSSVLKNKPEDLDFCVGDVGKIIDKETMTV